jgi:hypothetical protein
LWRFRFRATNKHGGETGHYDDRKHTEVHWAHKHYSTSLV